MKSFYLYTAVVRNVYVYGNCNVHPILGFGQQFSTQESVEILSACTVKLFMISYTISMMRRPLSLSAEAASNSRLMSMVIVDRS